MQQRCGAEPGQVHHPAARCDTDWRCLNKLKLQLKNSGVLITQGYNLRTLVEEVGKQPAAKYDQ
jgi:hypothetical protein